MGKQWERDRNFGIGDRGFWDWWHRYGKDDHGGRDLQTRSEAETVYEEWVESGKPKAPKAGK